MEAIEKARRHSAEVCELLRSISTLMQLSGAKLRPRDEAFLHLVQHAGELAEELDHALVHEM